ncbi:MAG: calcium-binding protein [Cetobacterium sp.]
MDKNAELKTILLIVGDNISQQLRKSLIAASNNKLTSDDAKILHKEYGKDWKSMFDLKSGGNDTFEDIALNDSINDTIAIVDTFEDITFDDSVINDDADDSVINDGADDSVINDDADDSVINVDADDSEEVYKKLLNKTGDMENISLDEIKFLAEEIEDNRNDQIEDTGKTINKKQKINTPINRKRDINNNKDFIGEKFKRKINLVFDATLYPFDNIFEFKKKLSIITNIPIYKQNLSYKRDKIYNLNYNIFIQKTVSNKSLKELVKKDVKTYNTKNDNMDKNDKIDDIPIIINYFNLHDMVKVKQYDTFSVLNTFSNLGIYEFDLFDLDDFISNTSTNLINSKYNKNQLDIIYYGFIVLFWPMLTFHAWNDYISNTNKSFEIIYPDLALNENESKRVFSLEKRITDNALRFYTKEVLKESVENDYVMIYDGIKKDANQNNSTDSKKIKSIQDDLYIGITGCNIIIKSYYDRPMLDLRNLFDLFELNDMTISSQYSFEHRGTNFVVNKVYKDNESIHHKIYINSTTFKLFESESVYMYAHVYHSGDIIVTSRWLADKLLDFTDIYDLIQPKINKIIKKINSLGSMVISTNHYLQDMTPKNTKFSDISFSFTYRGFVDNSDFKTIGDQIIEYNDANIIKNVSLFENNYGYNFYFSKGMYKFDEDRVEKNLIVDNYYAFLTDNFIKEKWETVYTQARQCNIRHQFENIQIFVNNIREDEFSVFYIYIFNLLYTIKNRPKTKIETDEYSAKTVKALKHKDPLLYDFKKIYNSNMIYSRLCQKQNQPVILNNNEIAKLSENDKNRVVNYWNFTTKSSENYYCPRKEYPHVTFIINKHPKNYCVPCCRIKTYDSKEDERHDIYNKCLQEHIYTDEKTIQDSRYVLIYGKPITPGRIMHLPEFTISPLIYESLTNISIYNDNQLKELSCNTQYYIYGIEQNKSAILNSLSFSLEMSKLDIIEKITNEITRNNSYFKSLLDGNIFKYFKTEQQMVSLLKQEFLDTSSKKLSEKKSNKNESDVLNEDEIKKVIPWNEIFIDLAYYCLSIVPVVFYDVSSRSTEQFELLLDSKIRGKILPNSKILFLIKKRQYYNPIISTKSVDFFKSKTISTKLFEQSDQVLTTIKKLVEYGKKYQSKDIINLDIYTSFIKSENNKRNYRITKYFVNKHNLCYYIEISFHSNKIYVPLVYSEFIPISDVEVNYDSFEIKKYRTKIHLMNLFIKDYNHWVAIESKKKNSFKFADDKSEKAVKNIPLEQLVEPIYPFIRLQKWIYLNNPWVKTSQKSTNVIIGFIHNSVNYYFEPISYAEAKRLFNAPTEKIIYHPDYINKQLLSTTVHIDDRKKNITKNIYKYHLYEILLGEYINLFHKEKNTDMRLNIKKQLIKHIDKDLEKSIEGIKEILDLYYKKIKSMDNDNVEITSSDNVIVTKKTLRQDEYHLYDLNRLLEQINNYVVNHKDIKILMEDIDHYIYNFDKIRFNNIRNMDQKSLYKELLKIAPRIVRITKESEINKILSSYKEFPNMLFTCQDNSTQTNSQNIAIYCKKNKLMITEDNLKTLLEIMSHDIINPLKQKWILNASFVDNTLNKFRFIKRPNEIILVKSLQ